MSIIAAGTTTTTALSSTGNTDGTLQFQVNGTTPSVTLNTLGAIGVGSTPNYGTSGQALVSGGSTAAPTWASVTTSPAGSNTQIQYNNAGAFGASSNLTWNGSALAVTGAINATGGISGTAGANISGAGWGVLPYVANSLVLDNNSGESRFFATGANSTTDGSFLFYTGQTDGGANERFRIGTAGQFGIGGANYGTSGQVLTSGGSGAAPTWSDAAAPTAGKLLASGTVSSSSGVTLSWATTGVKRIQVYTAMSASSNFDAYIQVGNTTSVSSSASYTVSRMAIQSTTISGNSSGSATQWQITSTVASPPSVLQAEIALNSNGNPVMKSEIQQNDSTYGLYKAAGFFNGNWTQFQSVRVWWDGGNGGRVTVVGFTE